MRIYGDPDRARTNLRAGRERRRTAIGAVRGSALRPPEPGTILRIIRVEDCLAGACYRFEIRQGRRRNSIVVTRHGRAVRFRHGTGLDALFRQMRADWKIRWIVEN
jgi:hypothetical protein